MRPIESTSPGAQPILRVNDLSITLPGEHEHLQIVEDVSFEIYPGEVMGLAGESGSGKTILALSLMGLLPPGGACTGTMHLGTREILSQSARSWRRIRGREIGMVFQDPLTALHPMLSIGEQLTEHIRDHGMASRKAARSTARDLLERVRLPNATRALGLYPHELSGGMRQRVAIAMALACEPTLLIADEPTTALDVTVQAGILGLLRELCDGFGLAVLLITHDLGVMSSVANRLSIIYSGRLVETGPTRALLTVPRHPYTLGLLESLPAVHRKGLGDRFEAIPGFPPNPGTRPKGCSFHPRCAFAGDKCAEVVPPLLEVDRERRLACMVDPMEPK